SDLGLEEEERVRVEADVVLVAALFFYRVADEAAEERDVGAGANGDVDVGGGRGAVVARVGGAELRAALPARFHPPLEAAGMVLGGVAAHREDDVRVPDVGPSVRHGSAAERGGGARHPGAGALPR